MKILLLCPKMYTIADTFKLGFTQNGCEIVHYDYREDSNNFQENIHTHIKKFPFKVRSKWYRYYVNKVNRRHLQVFKSITPDFVLVYNSELLLSGTIDAFKQKAKVVFFLGDSPFYTQTNEYYLNCLMRADKILVPDTGFSEQLNTMGISQTEYFLIGSNPMVNYSKDVTENEIEKLGSDLVFIGSTYSTLSGYKRAFFLNQFSGMDIKIYISGAFRRWYTYFPALEDKVVHPTERPTDEDLNTILNCCKIYPVDANPGILNGVHLRVFDCIASGILPLAEYRKDIKEVFGKVGIPIIYDYNKAASMAQYYLDNESERKEISQALTKFVEHNYSPEISIGRLLDIVR